MENQEKESKKPKRLTPKRMFAVALIVIAAIFIVLLYFNHKASLDRATDAAYCVEENSIDSLGSGVSDSVTTSESDSGYGRIDMKTDAYDAVYDDIFDIVKEFKGEAHVDSMKEQILDTFLFGDLSVKSSNITVTMPTDQVEAFIRELQNKKQVACQFSVSLYDETENQEDLSERKAELYEDLNDLKAKLETEENVETRDRLSQEIETTEDTLDYIEDQLKDSEERMGKSELSIQLTEVPAVYFDKASLFTKIGFVLTHCTLLYIVAGFGVGFGIARMVSNRRKKK